MTKKKISILSMFLALLLIISSLLAGCGGSSSTGAKQTALKNKDKQIAYAFGSWPKPPLFQGNPFAAGGVGEAQNWYYCGLFQYWNSTGSFKPFIAESYEQDGLKTTVHLRHDVKWTDGKPFTSKDVWAFYVLNNGLTIMKFLDSIETPDDYTVVYNWDKMSPTDKLKMEYIAQDKQDMIPYHIYGKYVDKANEILSAAPVTSDVNKKGAFSKYLDQKTTDALNQNWQDFTKDTPKMPVGTGPFIIKTVTASDMILVKNPNFFWKNKVKFNQVHLYMMTTQPAGLAMFKNGKTNMAGGWETGGTKDIIEGLLNNNKDLVFYPAGDVAAFGTSFNIQNAPLNDVNVRKAIIYAMDRKKIRDVANPYSTLTDYAAAGLIPFPQFLNQWVSQDVQDKLTKYPYDKSKAEEILKGIGWQKGSDGNWKDKSGKIRELKLACQSGWPVPGMEVQAEQLRKFGIPAKLQVQDGSVYYTNVERPKAQFDMGWDYNINQSESGTNDAVRAMNDFFNGFAGAAGNFPTYKSGADVGRTNMTFKDYDGKDVNINDVLKKMPYMSENELKDATGRLVWIINENALAMTWFWNTGTTLVNAGQIGGVPMESLLAKYNRRMPMPKTNKDYDDVFAFWAPHILKYYVSTGAVYPK